MGCGRGVLRGGSYIKVVEAVDNNPEGTRVCILGIWL